MSTPKRWENLALAVVSILGAIAFAFPFVFATLQSEDVGAQPAQGRTIDASLLLAVVVAGSLMLALGEFARGSGANVLSRSVALLGVLVALDATLRLVPSFFGASPIFALIIIVGSVFGSRFGFVMGALTLLLSAAITAGVGPWLPFQMLCAGWIGLIAGWLPRGSSRGSRVATLAVFGGLAGLLYGLLINLYAWPFAAPGVATDVGLYWYPGLGFAEVVQRYVKFYLATSLVHDLTRSAGNMLLLIVAGAPVIRLLQRFETKSSWTLAGAPFP